VKGFIAKIFKIKSLRRCFKHRKALQHAGPFLLSHLFLFYQAGASEIDIFILAEVIQRMEVSGLWGSISLDKFSTGWVCR
jgi:hypothetical protein